MIDGFTEFIFDQWCQFYNEGPEETLEEECEKFVQCYKIVLKYQKQMPKKVRKHSWTYGTLRSTIKRELTMKEIIEKWLLNKMDEITETSKLKLDL